MCTDDFIDLIDIGWDSLRNDSMMSQSVSEPQGAQET